MFPVFHSVAARNVLNITKERRALHLQTVYEIIAVVAGVVLFISQTCDTSAASTAFSFGANAFGQLGIGMQGVEPPFLPPGVSTATPIDTTNLAGKRITQVAAGGSHSLLLADDGTVFSFGYNVFGQTGLGSGLGSTWVATPIDATNLSGKRITQVAAGGYHSLLLADDGTVFSFGDNFDGQGGTSAGTTYIATPIVTTNLAGKRITQVAAGGYHSLLLADDGTVFSFGWNYLGRTGQGNGDYTGRTLVATPIDTTNLAGKTIAQLAAGGEHSLLLADDGTVFSFGSNTFGQTGLGIAGLGSQTLVATPIDTSNLTDKTITRVAAGTSHSLLLSGDGTVFSFGNNDQGRTGIGTIYGQTIVATQIDSSNLVGRSITQVAAGGAQSLLLTDHGIVFSFGGGANGVGGTSSVLVATPIDTSNLAGMQVTGISAGGGHSLLLAVAGPALVGDYNQNGVVDAADYVVWRKTLDRTVAPGSGADGNFDGHVTQADYIVWKSRFGTTADGSGSATLAVPEPSMIVLLVVGGIATLASYKRGSILRRKT